MPVRIIFRGLILFSFPKPGEPNAGKLVAELINKRDIPRRPIQQTDDKPPHGPHEHNHGGQIQVATDSGRTPARVTGRAHHDDERLPVELADGDELDIAVVGVEKAPAADGTFRRAPSFFDHAPRLSDVMNNASIDSVREAARATLQPNRDLIRNTITVDAGIIRVRNVVMWDHGAFPLSGKRGAPAGTDDERSVRAASHTALKFVGSHWQGHMASEFVVDVWTANEVDLLVKKNGKPDKDHRLSRPAKATGVVNHRVPYDTVEMLITNYEVQENTAVPWGLDFQWLFEAAGYPIADLARDFTPFADFARTFDEAVFNHDRELLLESSNRSADIATFTMGRPFPYVVRPEGVETLEKVGAQPLAARPRVATTDEEDRPICIGGFK